MAGWVGRKTERESESLEGGQRDRITGFRSRTERDGKRQRKKEERERESKLSVGKSRNTCQFEKKSTH